MPSYRNYNPNTKYGRRKAREQAYRNYQNASPEEKQQRDEIGCMVWGVILFICFIIFLIIAYTKGSDAAIDWLK